MYRLTVWQKEAKGDETEKVGLKRGWRKVHDGGHHNLYFSQNIVTMIKSRNMKPAQDVACTGETNNFYKF